MCWPVTEFKREELANIKQVEKYSKTIELNPQILLIAFNVNRLNIILGRQTLSEWKLKTTTIRCSQETHLKYKYTEKLKVKG